MTVLIITHTAAAILGVVFAWFLMHKTLDRAEAEHNELLREYDDLAIAHGLLTDRDELGRFKK